ncbi:hypothetical protein GQ600_13705 [Phytophthora cactorum]|nr:hypothetical protein GQ600_13705 [Phytophthora cactorum]
MDPLPASLKQRLREKLESQWKTTDGGHPTQPLRALHDARPLCITRETYTLAVTATLVLLLIFWKLRRIVDALQDRFQAEHVVLSVMAIDEAMLPSRSSFNKMRVYMKAQAPQLGGQVVHVLRPLTGYEPAAVILNINQVLGPSGPAEKRLIVTDRFYTSLALSMRLLALGVRTVMTNPRGLCKEIIVKKKTRLRVLTAVLTQLLSQRQSPVSTRCASGLHTCSVWMVATHRLASSAERNPA